MLSVQRHLGRRLSTSARATLNLLLSDRVPCASTWRDEAPQDVHRARSYAVLNYGSTRQFLSNSSAAGFTGRCFSVESGIENSSVAVETSDTEDAAQSAKDQGGHSAEGLEEHSPEIDSSSSEGSSGVLQTKADERSVVEINALMSKMTTQGDPSGAIKLFTEWKSLPDSKPDMISYNFLLHAQLRTGSTYEDLKLGLKEMSQQGIKPNLFTYNILLRAVFRECNSFAAEEIMRRMELAPDADSFNLLISTCAADRRVHAAVEHLQVMLRAGFLPSKSTYNEVLQSAARLRRTRDALVVLKELKAQLIPAVPSTLADLLLACCEGEDPECGLQVLELMAARSLSLDQGSVLMTLNLAARAGSVPLSDSAWRFLQPSPGPALHPAFYLARIQACASAGLFSQAFAHTRTLEQQLAGGPWASQGELLCPLSSLRPLTTSLSRGVGVLDNAYYLLADHQSGSPPSGAESGVGTAEVVSRSALNCVIAGCSLVRDMERAQQTFDELETTFQLSPDVHSFNALMEGYAKTGQATRVEELFAELANRQLQPSKVTHSLKVTAYITSRQAEKAVEALQEMEAAGHVPPRDLLLLVFRRSKRDAYQQGIDHAAERMRFFGYRPANAGEGRRRYVLEELSKALSSGYQLRYNARRWHHEEAENSESA